MSQPAVKEDYTVLCFLLFPPAVKEGLHCTLLSVVSPPAVKEGLHCTLLPVVSQPAVKEGLHCTLLSVVSQPAVKEDYTVLCFLLCLSRLLKRITLYSASCCVSAGC